MTIARIAAVATLVLGLAAGCREPGPVPPPQAAATAAAASTPVALTAAGESCTALPRPPGTLRVLAACCALSVASNPSCRLSEPRDGYVLLKDNSPRKPQSWLIVPAAPVSGIEDPAALSAPVADLFQHGFALAAHTPGRPAADTALAINSQPGRTQDQLHIHISCVRPAVRQALLAAAVPAWPAAPVAVSLPPRGDSYQVVRIAGLGGASSPFRRVAERPGARGAAAMADESIAVIGTATSGEYFLVNRRSLPGRPAEAEELLDQTCAGVTGG